MHYSYRRFGPLNVGYSVGNVLGLWSIKQNNTLKHSRQKQCCKRCIDVTFVQTILDLSSDVYDKQSVVPVPCCIMSAYIVCECWLLSLFVHLSSLVSSLSHGPQRRPHCPTHTYLITPQTACHNTQETKPRSFSFGLYLSTGQFENRKLL